jgi:hypothetical protein
MEPTIFLVSHHSLPERRTFLGILLQTEEIIAS